MKAKQVICLSIFLLYFIFFPFHLLAQLDKHTWFFGGYITESRTGMRFDFETNEPSQYNEVRYPLHLRENNIIIAHPNTGEIIFYSDGQTVIDRTHQPMPNGTGLEGSLSSHYGTTVVFDPSGCDRYLIFSAQSFDEASPPRKVLMSAVDLSLPGNGTVEIPLGDVDPNVFNVDITPSGVSVSEGIYAISKADKPKESWIFVADNFSQDLLIFDVAATGVTLAQTYYLGDLMPGFLTQELFSCLVRFRATNDEEGILVIGAGRNFDNDSYPIGFGTFNRISGTIETASFQIIDPNTTFTYGIEFSPDGSKMYYSDYSLQTLNQYDFNTGDLVIIATSPHFGRSGGLLLAPNNKIYWSNKFAFNQASAPIQHLSTIHQPNNAGAACNFQLDDWVIGGNPNPHIIGALPTFGTFPLPSTIEAVATTGCGQNNGAAAITLGEVLPPVSFLWDNGELAQTATMLSSGEHLVTVTDGSGCEDILSVFIEEGEGSNLGIINITPENPSNCVPGNDGFLTLSGQDLSSNTDYILTYDFNGLAAAPITVTTNVDNEFIVNNLSIGIYSNFVLTTEDGLCAVSIDGAYDLVTPNQPPAPEIFGSELYCFGDSLSLSASEINMADYEWNGPNGFSSNLQNPFVSNNLITEQEGIYSVVVIVDGCTSLPATIDIMLDDSTLELGPDTTLCEGISVSLQSPSGFSNYEWSNGETTSSITTDSAGLFTLAATTTNNCLLSDSILVSYIPTPTINLANFYEINLGDSLLLMPNIFPNLDYEYLWTPAEGLSCFNCESPFARPDETTDYTFSVSNNAGCAAEVTVTVRVNNQRQIFIPNVFSPNGDGINDVFYIFSDSSVDRILVLKIFDRWGELIYEAIDFQPNDPLKGWDGTFRKEVMQPAVFTYFAEVLYEDGFSEVLKGDITLIR